MKVLKVSLKDVRYPILLKEIFDPPQVLYAWGNLEILERPLCAVVGTRRASAYGEAQAFRFAKELSERGVCVVSGLAFGIDKAAHLGALEGEGGTIAVVAQGIEELEPSGHRGLAEKIVEKGGLILSEKACGEVYFKSHYLVRNRIIAGLCKGTLVIEAPFKSGARNTAKHALDYGRELMALPGRITDEKSEGTNALIQTGAALVTGPQEVAEILGVTWTARKVRLEGLAGKIFEELRKAPRSPAELGEKFSELSELYGVLGELEMKGLIRFTREQRYAVCVGGKVGVSPGSSG